MQYRPKDSAQLAELLPITMIGSGFNSHHCLNWVFMQKTWMYTEAAFLCWGHQGPLLQGSESFRSAILWDEATGNWASAKRGKFSRALVLQHMVQHMVCMSTCGNLSNRYPQRPHLLQNHVPRCGHLQQLRAR